MLAANGWMAVVSCDDDMSYFVPIKIAQPYLDSGNEYEVCVLFKWPESQRVMALEDKGMAVAACGGDDNDMSCFVQPYLDDPHLYLC